MRQGWTWLRVTSIELDFAVQWSDSAICLFSVQSCGLFKFRLPSSNGMFQYSQSKVALLAGVVPHNAALSWWPFVYSQSVTDFLNDENRLSPPGGMECYFRSLRTCEPVGISWSLCAVFKCSFLTVRRFNSQPLVHWFQFGVHLFLGVIFSYCWWKQNISCDAALWKKLNRVCNRISGATLLARFLFSTARIETSMSLVEDTPWSRKLSLGGNATILPTQNRVEPGLADVMGQTAIEVRVWGLQMLVLLAQVYGITGIWAPHILYLSLFILSWTPSLWIIFHCLCLLTLFYTVPLCILFIIYFILFI